MKKILQLIAVVTLFFSGAYAQNIVQGEYFFDADPGVSGAHRFSLTAGADISESLTIPTTGLAPGFHNLFIRVKNEYGIWSQYESRPVYIYDPSTVNPPKAPLKKIVSGEWFVDTDPGIGKATAFALTADSNIVAAIKMQLPTLAVGDHNLFVRVKNEDNVWSQYESQAFTVCPPPPAPIAKDTTICVKTRAVLKAKGTGTLSWYTQATGGKFLATADSLVVDTLSATTTFYVQDSLCDVSATRTAVKVTVNALPKVLASLSKTTLCIGDSLQLGAQGAKTYTWNVVPSEKGYYIPTQTSTLKVTGTDANGCENTDSIKVIVNTLPNVKAFASKTTLCVGDSTQLTSTGATQLAWNLNAKEGQFVKPTTTTTYQVTGTDGNGCKNSDIVVVIVNQLPVVKAKASKELVCKGDQVTLFGEGAQTYTWDNNVTNNEAFVPTKEFTYTVTGEDANGCSNSAYIGVKVVALPTVVANISKDTICAGDEVIFTGSGASTYAWDNKVQNNVGIKLTQSANFKVTGTDANGCKNTDSIKVVVYTLPVVKALASKTTLCAGDSTQLTSTGATKVSWNLNVQEGNYVKPTQSTTYHVTGTDGNGCKNTANVEVKVNQLPNVTIATSKTIFCKGDTLTLTGQGATSYVWDTKDKPSVNQIKLTLNQNLEVKVTGSDLGCQSTAVFKVVVDTTCQNGHPLAIQEIHENRFAVYPNPNQGKFTIAGAPIGSYTIQNQLGAIVHTFEVKELVDQSIQLDQLAKGIYFIVGSQHNNINEKIVIVE